MSRPSHRAMPDHMWEARFQKFASTGVWPKASGNRPAPKQKKWYSIYQQIQMCAFQKRHGGNQIMHQFALEKKPTQTCTCGYHYEMAKVTPHASAAPPLPSLQESKPTSVTKIDFRKYQFIDSNGSTMRSCEVKQHHLPDSGPPCKRKILTDDSPTTLVGGLSQPTTMVMVSSSQVVSPVLASTPADVTAAATSQDGGNRSLSPTALPSLVHGNALRSPENHIALQLPAREEPGILCPDVTLLEEQAVLLPPGWKATLPIEDQKWISKLLFRPNAKGKPEFVTPTKMWHDPPSPPLLSNQPPVPTQFFSQSLLVWMPYKMWQFKFHCPGPQCDRHQLTGGSLHRRARQVLDVDRFYSVVTEQVECTKCHKRMICWSNIILDQLDAAHRIVFSAILTHKYACDVRVIRLLRERTLGNTPTRLFKQLTEQHNEVWLGKVLRYLNECSHFTGVLISHQFQEPPGPAHIPSYKWLRAVYTRDILLRLDEVKAAITSVYGRVVKLDSTKKVTKKLAGADKNTALWCSSVGNEYGQILMCVMTAAEGAGLEVMAEGLVRRYHAAGEHPPLLIYVDRDCCAKFGVNKTKRLFKGWPFLETRLDIYHFMRRISVGCTTDAHPLYAKFMASLSTCIFEWDSGDIDQLTRAKRADLEKDGFRNTSTHEVKKRITKVELSLHCRRRTRGIANTTAMIQSLLDSVAGDNGKDSLGVPLLDSDRIWDIWETQKEHVKCIQDPPMVQLYTEIGTLQKGGVTLKKYRCARGSTSLESYHLHLNRFIPGTSANALNFQGYLLEGLKRWNDDRASQAMYGGSTTPDHCYNGQLLHSINKLSQQVLQKEQFPNFRPPGKYTGELIGMEYLYSQTGKVLQTVPLDPESKEAEAADAAEEEMQEGLEDLQGDIADPTLTNLIESGITGTSPSVQTSQQTSLDSSAIFAEEIDVFMEHEGDISDTILAGLLDTEISNVTPEKQSTAANNGDGHQQSTKEGAKGLLDIPANTEEAGENANESGGPDNQPGYQHVDNLADYLVQLREGTSLSLTDQQASDIVSLWQKLTDHDQARVVYSARYQEKAKGGFKTPKKKSGLVPGVVTTTRQFLGERGSPAQKPDCCRLVAAICTKLCSLHRSPRKVRGTQLSRWSLILHDYNNIRQKVLHHAVVMEKTTLQLVSINQNTLVSWCNKAEKKQMTNVLLQGTDFPRGQSVASEPLLPARRLLSVPPIHKHSHHQYPEKEDQAGMAQLKTKKSSNTKKQLQPVPQLPQYLPTVLAPNAIPVPQQLPASATPGMHFVVTSQGIVQGMFLPTTPSQNLTTDMTSFKKKYVRKNPHNKCKKCGQERTAATGHSQYKGVIYCPHCETLSKAEWLAQMKVQN